jgi:hypothetical protein
VPSRVPRVVQRRNLLRRSLRIGIRRYTDNQF